MKFKGRKIIAWLNKYEWLILILGLVIIFRIPSLFEPHHYGDEEIYFVMGNGWRHHWQFYREIFDHKPPLIYIMAGMAKSVFWFRLMLMIWMLIYTILFWWLSGWIWNQFKYFSSKKRKTLQIISTLIFAFLSTWPRLEGQIANGELFMMMPAVAGLVLLLKVKKKTSWHYLGAGLLGGIGFLFKIPVAFDFLAFMLFLFPFERKSLKQSILSLLDKNWWLMGVGFLLPFLITLVYYQAIGLGKDFIQGVLLINLGYTSSYATSSYKFNPLASGLFIRFELLMIMTLILYMIRKKINRGFLLTSLWLSFSLFGALLSDRPYPHYLQEIVPAGSLWLTSIFGLEEVVSWLVWGSLALAMVIAQQKINFWYYPTISYYKNFIDKIEGKKSTQAYINYFSNSKLNFKLAKFLKERMTPTETLYVWGTDSALYNLMDKLPMGGKYIVSFHVRDFRAYKYTMKHLQQNKPDYVVIEPNPIPFPELFSWLEAKYIKIADIDGAKVYKRL